MNIYFFFSFSNSLYCNVLGNFIGGYSKNEPIIYKAPKRIFEKLLTLKKILNDEKYFQYILDIYDSVYIIKNESQEMNLEKNDKNQKRNEKSGKKRENKYDKLININQESNENLNKEDKYKTIITFLEFYKFYFTSPKIANYFYYIVNSDYVDGKLNKNNRQNIKYTYKYKKIDFDQNLILKYIYLLKQMDKQTKLRCFKLTDDNIKTEQIITNNFISSCIGQFYINSKLIDYKDLIRYCILGIVALSASKHKLVHFTE